MGRRSGLVLVAVGLAMAGTPGCNEGDTITAPTLGATCSASPSEGAAPLEVSFALNVSGAEGPVTVLVSYGDGTTGSDPDATHRYGEGGLYTASFTVTTASQSARCATSVDVSAGRAGGPTPIRRQPAAHRPLQDDPCRGRGRDHGHRSPRREVQRLPDRGPGG